MNDDGDIRIIRPMVYVRESQTKEFSYAAKLPVINENCPACFEGPKERHRVKKLLAQEENLFPGIFGNIKSVLLPLMDAQMYHEMASIKQSIAERNEKRNKGKNTGKKTGKNKGKNKGKKKVAEESSSSSSSSSSNSNSNSSSTEKCSTA